MMTNVNFGYLPAYCDAIFLSLGAALISGPVAASAGPPVDGNRNYFTSPVMFSSNPGVASSRRGISIFCVGAGFNLLAGMSLAVGTLLR